ncbi:GCN5-related N-acetyltransferas-like protein [Myriangium duriaei CBS 260.36]|uniref:GCN5-related N-acetyltransferas-like protein n=1 Tax=Myriangium duriaei CBS 260.36 TaxID=1168546 RepID=A0A9P4MH50_9PEZI|nr:GCN5-related N-acetyltransferas-like protein [Myriangium duriaei CBS 260.36]
MAPPTTITHATKDDVNHIFALIHELASYERSTSAVTITPATLSSTLRWAPSPSSAPTGPGYAQTLLLTVPATSSTAAPEVPSDNPVANHSYLTNNGKDEVVGMALYFTNYSTWRGAPGIYLEDLFVRPVFRGRGYGTTLIAALAKETKAIGGARLEWSCLSWNEPSLKFYKGLGAEIKDGWVVLRCEGEALEKLAVRER